MKVYPKISRYDHPVVSAELFDAEDLTLIEKFDGSAFRFTLYDQRYAGQVASAGDGDGSLVFGTRKTVRGNHRDSLDEIDGALHRAVRCLREGVDIAALRTLHDEYEGPLIVYAENLVYSTLDYGYTNRDLPALVSFDVLLYTEIEAMTPPGNPYEETFEGFLDIGTAWEIFERIRVDTAPTASSFVSATILECLDGGFDPETYTFPASSLADSISWKRRTHDSGR